MKWRFLQALKHRAETEDKSLLTIYQEESANYPDVELPPFNRLRSTLWKRRQFVKTVDTERTMNDDTKINLLPFRDVPKDQMEQGFQEDFQEAEDAHFEDIKVVPQIFTEFVSQYPTDGNIVEVVEGPKRFSRVFIDDIGYAYHQNKKRKGGTVILRCHTDGCSGSGIFNPETTSFQRLAAHFHNPCQSVVQKLRFLQKVKLRAENETTSLAIIYCEEASRFPAIALPSYEKIKSTLRKRRLANLHPKGAGGRAPSLLSKPQPAKESVATHYIVRKGMEMIEGQKRFSMIYIDDLSYCYLVNRKKDDGSLILRCHEEGCRGSGRFDPEEGVFHKIAKHTHYADPLLVTKWRFLNQCKRRAENEATPIKSIYEQERLRHTNCNLPSFKKIESTLQKRRKVYRLRTDEARNLVKGEPSFADSPPPYNLEVQLQEVYHPEGNPHYFLSPDIAYDPPSSTQRQNSNPTSIVVKTGIIPSYNLFEKTSPLTNSLKEQRIKTENTAMSSRSSSQRKLLFKKKSRKKKVDLLKSKGGIGPKRLRSKEPRRPSDYTSKMEVMEGTKRFSKIFMDDAQHIYRVNKTRLDGALILKCYEIGCHGSGVYFPPEEVFRRIAEHSHNPSTELVAKCRLLSNLKIRAENESGPLRVIYEEEVSKFPGVDILSFRQMESTLQKRRRAKIPSEPQSLREAAVQLLRTEFSKCSRGNFFRKYLNLEGHEVLVFVSPGLLDEKFKESKTFHLDSSFRVIPQGFAQVVVIHLVTMDHIFPVVYALLTSKSESVYFGLFEFVRDEFPGFDPSFVSSDYECDLEAAFQAVFPNAIISGTWFHYTQSVWKQLRSCGLARVFFQDEEAKLILNCVMALPLLPASRIPDGISFLHVAIVETKFHLKETKQSLFKVIDFIQEEWIQQIGTNRLSVFGLDRKINYDIEAVCQFFIKKLGVEALPLIKFVEKIFQAESVILSDFEQMTSGKTIRLDKSRRFNENEKMLKEICLKFEAGATDVANFLRMASAAVPRHCHHDDVVCDDDDPPAQDPSDIPGSLPFCEIRVVAPADPLTILQEKPETFSAIELDASILIGDIHFSPMDTMASPGALPLAENGQAQCQRDCSDKKEFTALENVWPHSVHQHPEHFMLSQNSSLSFPHKDSSVQQNQNDDHLGLPGSSVGPQGHGEQPPHDSEENGLTLQHVPHSIGSHQVHDESSHHISEDNLSIDVRDDLCQVRLADSKSEVLFC